MPDSPSSHDDPVPSGFSPDALLAAIIDSAEDAIISKDLNGIVTSWNRSAKRVFGYNAEEIVGQTILKLLPAERQSEENMILERLRRGERIENFETERVRKDGTRFPVSVTITPIRDRLGHVVGAVKVARDLSMQRRAAELSEELAAIVDSSDDAIISKDLNGVVTTWNPGAERIFGYTAAEMIGQPIWRLFPTDRWEEEPRILERIRRGERVDHFESKRVRKDGSIIDVSVTISPIRDRHGKVVGASKIARDITEKLNAHRRLVQANDELRRADQMKSEFLSTLSHELRTPLNAILGWTQVLKETGYDDPHEVDEAVTIIERNARAQATMIEDLLDVSRIVSGKVVLDIQQLDLPAVVEAAIESLAPTAAAKGIRVTSAFSSVGAVVMGDRNRMQQVVWNLLSNAIKFTQRGGRVHVTIQRRNSHVQVAVSDNGQGIRRDFLPYVFERFAQADGSSKRRHGGLGLGLSIVKQLIELHGGDVQAESEGEGKGATFIFSVPVITSRFQEDRAAAADATSNTETPDHSLRGLRVLAVDDEPDSVNLVKRILESKKATVRTAGSAAEAMAHLAEEQPHILLSDIGMPDQDGYDLIKQVRSHPHGRFLPAVALTALARSEDRTRCLRAGFQTHVAKPVEPAELIAVVTSLAALRE